MNALIIAMAIVIVLLIMGLLVTLGGISSHSIDLRDLRTDVTNLQHITASLAQRLMDLEHKPSDAAPESEEQQRKKVGNSKIDIERLRQLCAMGKSQREIAAELNSTKTSIARAMRKHNITKA